MKPWDILKYDPSAKLMLTKSPHGRSVSIAIPEEHHIDAHAKAYAKGHMDAYDNTFIEQSKLEDNISIYKALLIISIILNLILVVLFHRK